MKLLFQTTIVFFSTMLAAALVALGDPGRAEVQMLAHTPPAAEQVASLLGLAD